MSIEYLQLQTRKILSKLNIDENEFANAINLLFSDEIPECTIASFLTALTYRGVNYNELRIIREILIKQSLSITPRVKGSLIDNCGTGGDIV